MSGDAPTAAIVDEVLRYGSLGWHIFPVHSIRDGRCTCGVADCGNPGKHPLGRLTPHGLKDASNYADPLRRWWTSQPLANVGLRCGSLSRIVAIDVDPRHGGTDGLAALEAKHGPLPMTPESLTGGEGRHLVFRHPGGIVPGQPKLGQGVELKGDENYIILPPSLHLSGRRYSWREGRSPWDLEPAALPEWILRAKPEKRTSNALNNGELIGELRNVTLTSLAGSMRARGMTYEAIRAGLHEENAHRCDPPLPDHEIETIAKSIGRKPPGPRKGAAASSLTDENTLSPVRHCSDDGNALRLVDRYGDDLRHVDQWGLLVWDGKRWSRDNTRQAVRFAREAVRNIGHEAVDEPDPTRRAELFKHARASEGAKRIRDMIDLAKSDARIQARPEDFDRDPMLLTVANGTIDLRLGQLRKHRREDLITKLVPIEADPAAKCPRFERFLADVFPGSENGAGNDRLIRYVQRVAGYSLTGHVREHALFLCYGRGRNGKTTLLEILKAVAGEYGYQASPNLVLEHKNSGGPRDGIAQLCGVRIVIAVEPERQRRLNVALVKWITGGDELNGSYLYKDSFTFKPTHSPWVAANHRPAIDETSDAIWERIHLIPFLVSFKGREDKTLIDALRAELPGILNWVLRGCLAWQEKGLDPPDEVRLATREYREESDSFQPFLEARCVLGSDRKVTAKDLRAAYLAWCDQADEKPLSTKDVGDRLRSDFSCIPGKGSPRTWRGIALRAEDEPTQGHAFEREEASA